MGRGPRVNVLVVFDQSEKSYQWSLSIFTLRMLLGSAILTVMLAVCAVFFAWRLVVQSERNTELAAENKRLGVYAFEINHLKEELAYHRSFTRRLCELVGVEFPDPVFPADSNPTPMVVPGVLAGSTIALSPSRGEDLHRADQALMPNQLAPHAENRPIGIPMRGRISRGFAPDEENLSLRHFGLDIAGSEGSPVLATAAGIVESVGWDEAMGHTIVIDHQNGFKTIYGHNSIMMCKTGDKIQFGDVICLSGNSGISSAPHLHYEIRYYGQPIDPLPFIFPDQTPILPRDSNQAAK